MLILEHNKQAYENVKECFKTSNRTCVVEPTGTGKSYVAWQFIRDNLDKRVLYVTSYKVTMDRFKTFISDSIEEYRRGTSLIHYSLYASLSSLIEYSNCYDCIILDEFHRTGASKWGVDVKTLLTKNPNAKVLGLSATPVRDLDAHRNMAVELFNNNIAFEMSLAESIVKGILPAPTYVTCMYELEAQYARVSRKLGTLTSTQRREAVQLMKKAKSYLEQSRGVSEVFEKYITDKSAKCLVFCKNLEHMDKMVSLANDWFSSVNTNISKYVMHSNLGYTDSFTELKTFAQASDDSLKLLFCCNMLNEGLHLDDVKYVILLRPTESRIVYLQQLGRGFTAGGKNLTIIDVVDNYKCLKDSEWFGSEVNNLIANNKSLGTIPKFKIMAEMNEFIDLLTQLNQLYDRSAYFNVGYEALCEYKKMFGNTNVPTKYTNNNGFALYRWCTLQRNCYFSKPRRLSEDKIAMLNDIGFDWESKYLWVKDHLGNTFKTEVALCRYYNIDSATFRSRLDRDWSLKDALTTPVQTKYIYDHLGNKYTSVSEMCKPYNIKRTTYEQRRKKGLSLEEALLAPVETKFLGDTVTDHLGNKYKSKFAMCKSYNITVRAFEGRINRNWSLKDALTVPIQEKAEVFDHLGNKYSSVQEMCDHYNMNTATFTSRMDRNWSLKDALTQPKGSKPADKYVVDHLGNKYKSIREMCDHYNIKVGTYNNRRKKRLSLEQILTTPVERRVKRDVNS